MPKPPKPKCTACQGTGISSKGKPCVPCHGTGRVTRVTQTIEKYAVLCIDPPWPKKKGGIRFIDKIRNTTLGRDNSSRELEYKTMPVADIFAMLDRDVLSLASETHTVFVWGIDQFLHDGEKAMLDRGYRMHARLVWDKENGVAPAFSLRYSHEYVTWWYKPRFMPVAKSSRGKHRTVIRESAREHSRKPDVFYKLINDWFPEERKLDVFSREKRDGWDQWGDELDRFSI